MCIVEAKNLIYDFKKYISEDKTEYIRAIDNISIKINQGQFISILGKNGSGKSTLAKLLGTLIKPTSGLIYIDGKDINNRNQTIDIYNNVGIVFQNPDNQIVSSIVENDVAFGPENIGLTTDEIKKRVNKSLENVDMLEYRYSSPNKLSGGQKQRIAIAGILAMQPKCIILDEPTAMLDPQGRNEVIKTISILNKTKGIAIILITHNMDETINSNLIIVIDDGKIVMKGTPNQIFSQIDLLKDHGLEVPQVTLLANELKKGGIPLKDGIADEDELIDSIMQYHKQMKYN